MSKDAQMTQTEMQLGCFIQTLLKKEHLFGVPSDLGFCVPLPAQRRIIHPPHLHLTSGSNAAFTVPLEVGI